MLVALIVDQREIVLHLAEKLRALVDDIKSNFRRLVLFSVCVFEASSVEGVDKVTIVVQETNIKEWRLVLQEITRIDYSIMHYVYFHQQIFYGAALCASCDIEVHQSEDAKLILSSLTVYSVLLLEIVSNFEYRPPTSPRISELVTQTLAAVGLNGVENRLPSELSGGMKKRVALARSLIFDTTNEVIEPEVLLYDEPTAGADLIVSTVVEDFIRSVHLTGMEDALGKLGKLPFICLLTIHTPGGFVFEWLIYDVGMKKKQVNKIPFCSSHELIKPSGFTKLNVLIERVKKNQRRCVIGVREVVKAGVRESRLEVDALEAGGGGGISGSGGLGLG
ncbi:hypothetical protein Bca101_010077 [Brassica carinata]